MERTHRTHLLGLALLLAVASGCAHGSSTTTTSAEPARGQNAEPTDVSALVDLGLSLRARGRCRDALAQGFEPAIERLSAELGDTPVIAERDDAVLAATSRIGNQQSLTMIITRQGPDGVMRRVISDYYPDLLFVAAYCYVEIGDLPSAEEHLRRALAVIPDDPLYLAEVGHIAHMRHDFADALPIYVRAVETARALEERSPNLVVMDMSITQLRHRCMRGVGFTLIELGSLDEAQEIYETILSQNPADQQARNELDYIARMRNQGNHL